MFRLPASPRLRRILLAYSVNQLGTWFGYVALSVAVYDHTHSAWAVAGLFLAARFVPAMAVPAVVARVEASPGRGRLSLLYMIEGIVATALGLLLLRFWLPGILFGVAIDGSAAMAASALLRAQAGQTESRELLGEGVRDRLGDGVGDGEQVQDANAALNIALAFCVVAGPALGGLVVAAFGRAAAMFIDAASFLACGALLIDLYPYIEEHGASSVARLRAAWDHLREARTLRRLLVAEAVALVFFQVSSTVEVFYAKSTLHAGDRGYGLLLAVWGVGMILGSVAFTRWKRRALASMLSVGALAVGLGYIGFAVAPTLVTACVAAVIGGVGNGVQWASVLTAVQRLTPSRLHGRVMGAVESIAALCPAVGLTLGAVLVAASSPRGAYLTAGLGACAMTVAFWWLSRDGLELDEVRVQDGPEDISGQIANALSGSVVRLDQENELIV